jgi:hypothetical protein
MLNAAGDIIEHFKCGESMPADLERARNLAATGQYAVIEVYADRLVAVADDGTTSLLKV